MEAKCEIKIQRENQNRKRNLRSAFLFRCRMPTPQKISGIKLVRINICLIKQTVATATHYKEKNVTNLGATWCKGTGNCKQNHFFVFTEISDVYFICWWIFVQFNTWYIVAFLWMLLMSNKRQSYQWLEKHFEIQI